MVLLSAHIAAHSKLCAGVSFRLAIEHGLDLRAAHGIEVVGNRKLPLIKPGRRLACLAGASSAVRFTKGLPAFAIITVSAASAGSIRRDRWVFASWMFADAMAEFKITKSI